MSEEPEAAAVEDPEAAPPAAAPVELALEVAVELPLELEPLAAEVLLLPLLLTQEESPSWIVTGEEYWIEPLASVILKVMDVPASISAFQVTWLPDSLSEMVSRAAADDWPPGITALQNQKSVTLVRTGYWSPKDKAMAKTKTLQLMLQLFICPLCCDSPAHRR